jgi:hypothetical protein
VRRQELHHAELVFNAAGHGRIEEMAKAAQAGEGVAPVGQVPSRLRTEIMRLWADMAKLKMARRKRMPSSSSALPEWIRRIEDELILKEMEADMAKLKMARRARMPSSSFALPGKGSGPSGKGSGSYPIPDASHARNALARSSGKPVAAAVRAKVKAKFPGIGKD